jgi:hypothetical protein
MLFMVDLALLSGLAYMYFVRHSTFKNLRGRK